MAIGGGLEKTLVKIGNLGGIGKDFFASNAQVRVRNVQKRSKTVQKRSKTIHKLYQNIQKPYGNIQRFFTYMRI